MRVDENRAELIHRIITAPGQGGSAVILTDHLKIVAIHKGGSGKNNKATLVTNNMIGSMQKEAERMGAEMFQMIDEIEEKQDYLRLEPVKLIVGITTSS